MNTCNKLYINDGGQWIVHKYLDRYCVCVCGVRARARIRFRGTVPNVLPLISYHLNTYQQSKHFSVPLLPTYVFRPSKQLH